MKVRDRKRFWLPIACVVLGLSGCAQSTNNSVDATCVVNPDQSTLFKGQWAVHPIPLAVVVNDFSVADIVSIQTAIDTWNAHFQAVRSYSLFLSNSTDLSAVASSGTRINASTVCSQSMTGSSGFNTRIMIYKDSANWTYGSSVIALTSLCPVAVASSTYKQFTAAVMEINYQNFFSGSNPVPDLQSVVLHELGHMLGMDHSCNGSACSTAPADYTAAVMYPALGFNGNAGVQNRTLQTNDQQRANCLYQ